MRRNDMFLYLFSFVITLLVWLYLADPARTEERNVTLTIRLAPGMAVVYPQETVPVMVTGTATSMARLKADDLKASVDVTGVTTEGVADASVHVTGPSSLNLTYTPKQPHMRLSLEKEKSRILPVEFDRPGLNGETATTVPPTVKVTGPHSVVERVMRAVVDYDLGRSASEQAIQWEVHLLARDREAITTLAIDPKTVQVDTNSISLAPRLLTVSPVIHGKPADGYTMVSTDVVPIRLSARLSPAQASVISALFTKEVNIEGAKADVQQTVEVVVPEGVRVIGPTAVSVTVRIVKVPGTDKKGKP